MPDANSSGTFDPSELRDQAPGIQMYLKGEPSYDNLNLYYNRALNQTPLAIVRPRSEGDVSKTVSFCSANRIRLTVRSGGHDFFGRSAISDGIVIDMRDIDFVRIDPENKTANVGGGTIAGPLQTALEARGFFTPTGQAKTVGYVSWACGGGYGFYVGSYGFGVDQILGARVVLADGSVVDTDEDRELLWALRGAGAASFGVVVELRVKIYPTPKLLAGFSGFPLGETPTVFQGLKDMQAMEGVPDEFSGDAIFARPEMLHLPGSEPCFIFYWCWTQARGGRGISLARAYLDKMKALGTVLIDTVEETTPASFGGGDSSSATFFRMCTVTGLEPTLGEIFARHPPPQPLAAVVIHNNHGLGVESEIRDSVGSAFHNRRRHVILGLHGGTTAQSHCDAEALSQTTNWVTALEERILLSEFCLDNVFPSFVPQNEVDPNVLFGRKGAHILSRLKRRLDPDDFFDQSLSMNL